MAITLNSKTRVCEITSAGIIPELGYISAPINKCKLTDHEILTILNRGFKVLEYNPQNLTDKKPLSLANGGKSPFTTEKNQEKEITPLRDIIEKSDVISQTDDTKDNHKEQSETETMDEIAIQENSAEVKVSTEPEIYYKSDDNNDTEAKIISGSDSYYSKKNKRHR